MLCKIHCERFLKNYKTSKESIPSNVADLFYLKIIQRALGHSRGTREAFKEHSKGTWSLEGHSKSTPRELKALGHLEGTWASKAPMLLHTRALKGHLCTQPLGHSCTQGTRVNSFSRLGIFSFLTHQLVGKFFSCAFRKWIVLRLSNLSNSLKI